MKAILEFDLTDPDESVNFEAASKASDLTMVIWSLEQWLRENYKYDIGEISIDDAEKVRNKLREIMDTYGLSFNNKIFN